MSILTRASSNNDCTALRDAQFSSKFINVYRVKENKKKKAAGYKFKGTRSIPTPKKLQKRFTKKKIIILHTKKKVQ